MPAFRVAWALMTFFLGRKVIFVDFYSSEASNLSIGSNESTSRLASSLVVGVVGSDISLVFSNANKPIKSFVIGNLIPVGLSLTTAKHIGT